MGHSHILLLFICNFSCVTTLSAWLFLQYQKIGQPACNYDELAIFFQDHNLGTRWDHRSIIITIFPIPIMYFATCMCNTHRPYLESRFHYFKLEIMQNIRSFSEFHIGYWTYAIVIFFRFIVSWHFCCITSVRKLIFSTWTRFIVQ